MPTIEVFLMFKPTDRNSHTTTDDKHKKTKIIEAGPAWNWIKAELAKKGYTLIVHGPSAHPSIQEIRDAMSNAEVTLRPLVGN